MTIRSHLAAFVVCLAVAMSASAADLHITFKKGDELTTLVRPIQPGQVVTIDERKRIEFKAAEGCAGIDTSALPSSVLAGLQVTVDAVQTIGDKTMFRIGLIDTEFEGTGRHEVSTGCAVQMPRTTATAFGPTLAVVSKTASTPTQLASLGGSQVGKPITLTVQIK